MEYLPQEEERLHAVLSPSSAERWMACPPSARINERLDDSNSRFAAEGTLAHSIAELQLRLATKEITKKEYNARLKELKADELFYPGMTEEVQEYTDLVMTLYQEAKDEDPAAEIFIEQRLDLDQYAPESFGTGDAVILTKKYVHVIDLKFGKGVAVSAEDNPQLKLYGLGAYEEYGFLHDLEELRATIAQVRLNSILTFKAPVADVVKWGLEVVRPPAELAFKGEGPFKAGPHCRFCRFGPKCKARALYYEAEFKKAQEQALSNSDVARLLGIVKEMVSWAKDLETYALESALAGQAFPGWKLVEGRSVRRITNEDGVSQVLFDEGFSKDDIYKPLQLKGLGELEKLAGKKRFSELAAPYIEKPPGKPTLAPESDRRPPIEPVVQGLDFDE